MCIIDSNLWAIQFNCLYICLKTCIYFFCKSLIWHYLNVINHLIMPFSLSLLSLFAVSSSSISSSYFSFRFAFSFCASLWDVVELFLAFVSISLSSQPQVTQKLQVYESFFTVSHAYCDKWLSRHCLKPSLPRCGCLHPKTDKVICHRGYYRRNYLEAK